MRLYVCVKGFGKIREAKIDISNFTVFVGNNNSGKTYMMQLIYGVLNRLHHLREFHVNFLGDFDRKVRLTKDMYFDLVSDINDYLAIYKESIVKEIFQKDIKIEQLRMEIQPFSDQITVDFEDESTVALSDEKNKDHVKWVKLYRRKDNRMVKQQNIGVFFSKDESSGVIYNVLLCFIFGITPPDGNVIYMPASRTGILLLYKYFFSERDRNNQMVFQQNKGNGILFVEKENDMGLTRPVYDFLQFLLRYVEENEIEENECLIRFIQKNLIDGRIENRMGNFVYKPDQAEEFMPLYLASSIVNELTPILMVLSNRTKYSYILYDEIETCLHPFKQKEMARLLNRMCNSGFKMIVSTHSDTMAAKLNNLFLLSFMEDKEKQNEKMKKLGLEEKDLLKEQNVRVYQFVNDASGKSNVEELKFRTTPYVGYDFSLFTENSMELYNEAEVILEDK